MENPIQLLRHQIQACLGNQEQLQHWCRWLFKRQQQLHHSIMLPAGYRASSLASFTRNYLLRLPDMLEHAARVAESNDLASCSNLIAICLDYLALPPPPNATGGGLIYDWLVRAYVGHRLLEEMQDWAVNNHGENLIPQDNTRANLLTHELLGETFCASLEDTIQTLCRVLEQAETGTLHQQRKPYSPPPCMLANAMAAVWLSETSPA